MATKRFELEDSKNPPFPFWGQKKVTPTKPFEPDRKHKSGVTLKPKSGNFLSLQHHLPVNEKYERKPETPGVKGEAIGLVPKRMQEASESRWLFYVAGWDIAKISKVTGRKKSSVYSAINKKDGPRVQPDNWNELKQTDISPTISTIAEKKACMV